jgi:hypothetical protein
MMVGIFAAYFEPIGVHCHHVPVSEEFETGDVVEAEEVVDGLPVIAEVHELERVGSGPALGAVQAVAAAATGFVAGAATMALARRYGARRLERLPAPRGGGPSAWPVAGTRTYLVHVHVLRRPWD